MMAKPQIVLDAKHISKSFGPKEVLRDVSLQVEKGKSTVVLGGSGSGKSVFLKCLLGLLHPDNGNVFVDGQETTYASGKERYEIMRKFGMVFQNGALFDSLPIWENVGFGLTEQGVNPKDVKEQAIMRLAQVGLQAEVADQLPSELSGGMRKRVAFARAICLEPEIIFYDEPTTGLDPITSDMINDLIIKLREELGVTSITITHDMNSAYKIADRIAMLYHGEIIAEGTVKEIQTTDNPFVQQFIHGRAEGPIHMAVKSRDSKELR